MAVTDSGREIERSSEKPGVSNLIEILAVARETTPEQVETDMADARGYGDLKTAVAEAVVEMLAPVRERYVQLRADEQALEAVLADGASVPGRSQPDAHRRARVHGRRPAMRVTLNADRAICRASPAHASDDRTVAR